MKYPIAELADKYTILMIKLDNGFEVADADVSNLFRELESTPRMLVRALEEINAEMWDLEEEITVNKDNLETVGSLCLQLRKLNLQRVEAKNRIARSHGELEEEKTY